MGEQVAARYLFKRGTAGVATGRKRMYFENCTQKVNS